jgi:hypothetical protein
MMHGKIAHAIIMAIVIVWSGRGVKIGSVSYVELEVELVFVTGMNILSTCIGLGTGLDMQLEYTRSLST